jgi:hypothetical protein
MPGFNQRGPMNEGPMTGRGLGKCAALAQDVGGIPDTTWNGPGYGRGRGMAMGRGRCRRTWWSMDMAGSVQYPRQARLTKEEALSQKIHQLEMELETLKNELKQTNKS